jgi:hypothetical protein
MAKLGITGVTISVEFGFEQEFGKGTKSFASISSRTPDGERVPLEELSDLVDQGLDMYLAAWKTLLISRFSTGVLSGKEFKEQMQAQETRLENVRKFLRRGEPSGE